MNFSELDFFWQNLYDRYDLKRASSAVHEKKNKGIGIFFVLAFIFPPFVPIAVLVIFLLIFSQNKTKKEASSADSIYNRRISSYIRVMRTRSSYVSYDTLARAADTTPEFARNDLSLLIARGELPGAVLDDIHRCIRLDQLNPRKAVQQPAVPVPPAVQKNIVKSDKAGHHYPPTAMNVPLDTPLKAAGDFYLSRLADLHSQADASLAPGILELREHLNKLIVYGHHHPKCASTIQNFLYRYMPSALKLITTGVDFSDFSTVSAEIADTRSDIVGVLSTMTTACDRQLEQLYQSDAIDISSDITVLENMLSQEGLIPSELEMKMPPETKLP